MSARTMAAVVLTGHGGPAKLEYRLDVPVPSPSRGEVLIEVSAASATAGSPSSPSPPPRRRMPSAATGVTRSTLQSPVPTPYVERGEVRPVVSDTYPLSEIARAQEAFLEKRHIGKLVLIPPPVDS